MNYDGLMAKLASSEIKLSDPLRDVMQRVRENGLHKLAAALSKKDEFTVKEAAEILGRNMIEHHLRYQKVAAGLQALHGLQSSDPHVSEKLAGAFQQVAETGMNAARKGMQAAEGSSSTLGRGFKGSLEEAGGAVRKAMPEGMPPIPGAAKPPPSAETSQLISGMLPEGSQASSAIRDLGSASPSFLPKPGPSAFSGEVGQGLDRAALAAKAQAGQAAGDASRATWLQGAGLSGARDMSPAMQEKATGLMLREMGQLGAPAAHAPGPKAINMSPDMFEQAMQAAKAGG